MGRLAVSLMREVESRPELGLRIVSQLVLPKNVITQDNSELQSECDTLSQLWRKTSLMLSEFIA